MANLRILSVDVIDSITISAKFTEKLDTSINTSNVLIESQLENIPSPEVLSISIIDDVLTLTTEPLTPQAAYIITFISSDILFKSLNGTSVLFQDGITNKQLILGPIEDDNSVKEFLSNYLKDNIYNINDSSTVVSKVIQSLSIILSKALYDIRQVKNENYLSFTVNDEQKIRGSGPFDRLLEESAYEVLRVGKTPTGAFATSSIVYDNFPYYPVSLLAESASEILIAGSTNKVGSFNINNFIITVSNQNISKLTSLIFNYTDNRLPYIYDISKLGYQIFNSTYDKTNASSYATLENNEIKISEMILNDSLFSNQNIFNIEINYEFRNLGKIIDSSSVEITTTLSSIRETLPPIINVFNLTHAPIINSSGEIPITGGVIFKDPNSTFPNALHPAFTSEIPFNLSALPYAVGQYSIDYSTGTVYVYGSSIKKDGTGATPPLATYKYLYTYKSLIDYTYDVDFHDIVALPNGNLINNAAKINFNYEQVLIPDIDYNSDTHIEVLSERIDNRLLALNIVAAKNFPVTNVFRIYNETSGEIYNIIRWSGNKIYFNYNNPPNVQQSVSEKASFFNVLNEVLFVNQELINTFSLKIFKCLLNNKNIISATEDCLGSSINTSVSFSDINIFKYEKWFDSSGIQTEIQNINKLTELGQYQIDYTNGIVYIAVSNTQLMDIGTINYKNNSISPNKPHVLSVDDIYYQINFANPKDKNFEYQNFTDGSIVPKTFDHSDEAFLNKNINTPYEINNNKIGTFIDATFIPGLTNNIKFVRGIFEFSDLQNNTNPINFAEAATSAGNIITTGTIIKEEFGNILFDGSNHYVNINLSSSYISDNLTFDISIIRNLDAAELWDNSGTIVAGTNVKLILSGVNSPITGQSVVIHYSITINDLSRVIVDYNKGDYFIDYSYLADEIIISYEYGDNVLDFRKTKSLSVNDQYYVSYKVGALRDALLKNFGTLINVPELATFNIDLDRERYRDAVSGALESFIIGPTIAAMKNLVQSIVHVEPEIIESAFQNWSLGTSLLNPQNIYTTGEFQLNPAKYGNGVLLNSPEQTITFPISSNLKLENGSFQTWVIPEWNGIDNEAPLTINILKNGIPVKSNSIFIGAAEYHPNYDINNSFTIDKNSNSIGTPNKNKNGIFIYYDFDNSQLFKRWFCEVVDGYADGYIIDGYNHNYTIKMDSKGLFYDVKSLIDPKPNTLSIQSGNNSLTFKINSLAQVQEGITFICDREHYILDFGENLNTNRLSLYKDPSGYLNFKVFDKQHTSYTVSADISNWKAHQLHHVAISWSINNKTFRDELHLFIDGFEVPNIIKYGNKVGPYLHEKFRTINPEEIAGIITKSIVGSIDLHTSLGSPLVSSSLNFSAYGITAGDTIYIDELGFNTNGYSILIVNGNILTLNVNMPITLTDAKFSVNRTEVPISTEISLYNNIAISTISSIYTASDLVATNGSNTISSASTNFITLGIVPGNLIRINNNLFENHYVVLSVSAHSLVLNGNMPATLSSLVFYLYTNTPIEISGIRALRPSYSIKQDANLNDVLVLSNNIKANDLILINTLGLNHRRIKRKFYQWGNSTNILKTRMAPPIDLKNVKIYHILFPTGAINSSNSSIVGSAITSNALLTEQPSTSTNGRTLSINVSTNNASGSINVAISGIVSGSPTVENIIFTKSNTLYTTNKFSSITNVVVSGTIVNANKTFCTLQIQEKYSITHSENSTVYPIVRYSYQVENGSTLSSLGSNVITDNSGFFSSLDVGNYIVINTGPATGTYQILSISSDHLSATINATVPSFTGQNYQVLNASAFRSGFQNGYFVLEQAALPGTPYNLKQGFYEFDFYSYLVVNFDPLNVNAFIGTDINGKAIFNGTIDEVKITSGTLTDTRVGETALNNVETITKDFNLVKEQVPDINTLFLSHFNSFPFTNVAPFYISSEDKKIIKSGNSVNDYFSQSIILTDKPLVIENNGILNSKSEGTIEFWVNPIFDTANDPNYRFYFDATAVQIENAISLNDVSIQIDGKIGKVLSVTLQTDKTIDYFQGGKVEINSTGAISENVSSINANTVSVSKDILQVITVKIVGDPTNTDYFEGGNIGSNKTTIYLGKSLPQNVLSLVITYKPLNGNLNLNSQIIRLNKKLPNQNTPVIITYVPNGSQGDRISIFKDPAGYVNFNVSAAGTDYLVRSPAYWSHGSWHRVKASFSVNGNKGNDNIHLFVDGYEAGNVLIGSGAVFGDAHVFGSSFSTRGSGVQTTINIKDFFGELYIGNNFSKNSGAFALLDNFRISNIARPIFAPFGESLDIYYNSNLNVVLPTTKDLYTTLLLDFESLLVKNEDFVMLQNKKSGTFDFSINIFDSFDILKNDKIKEVLESLIKILKPASSRVFINYR